MQSTKMPAVPSARCGVAFEGHYPHEPARTMSRGRIIYCQLVCWPADSHSYVCTQHAAQCIISYDCLWQTMGSFSGIQFSSSVCVESRGTSRSVLMHAWCCLGLASSSKQTADICLVNVMHVFFSFVVYLSIPLEMCLTYGSLDNAAPCSSCLVGGSSRQDPW